MTTKGVGCENPRCRHWDELSGHYTCMLYCDLTDGPWDDLDRVLYAYLNDQERSGYNHGEKAGCLGRDAEHMLELRTRILKVTNAD